MIGGKNAAFRKQVFFSRQPLSNQHKNRKLRYHRAGVQRLVQRLKGRFRNVVRVKGVDLLSLAKACLFFSYDDPLQEKRADHTEKAGLEREFIGGLYSTWASP